MDIVQETLSGPLFIMRICGLFPFDNHKTLFKIYSTIIYIILTTLQPILFLVWLVTEESLDFYRVSNSAFVAIELIIFIFKFLPCIIHGSRMIGTIYTLNKPIFSANIKPRQKVFLENSFDISRKLFWVFLAAVVSAVTILSLRPALLHTGLTPIEIWYPFNSTQGYVFTYCYVVIATVSGAIGTTGYDIIVAILIFQTTQQVLILKDNLQNLNEDIDKEIETERLEQSKTIKNFLLHDKIKTHILHHQNIISFLYKIQNDYSFGLFCQLFGSCLVICLSVLELTLMEPSFTYPYIFATIYTMNITFEICFYCYFGTMLYEESQSITTSIYMGNWLEYDVKSRRSLLILMLRANKPMKITAGGILELSLDTLSTILRRAYSVFAVLRQYRDIY